MEKPQKNLFPCDLNCFALRRFVNDSHKKPVLNLHSILRKRKEMIAKK